MKVVRAKLIELWSRVVKYDKDEKVYLNGDDNLYPNEIERVVMNSPTASRAATMFSKYIAGEDIEGENIVVNAKKRMKVTDLIKFIADDFAVQYGCFIHVGYGINEEGVPYRKSFDVLNYTRCRESKEDDEGNKGRILYKDFEEKKSSRFKNRNSDAGEKERWFYPYNPDERIVLAQMRADTPDGNIEDMIKNYRGQVLHVNLTPKFKYAISKFDSVFNDCDTEYRMSVYANTETRGGFLGKTCILTNGLDEEQSKNVENDIREWMGAEGSSSLYHLDLVEAEDLDKVLKIIQVPSQYDDDMFSNTDKRVRRSILGAANNIPEPLIYAAEGALFGTSGDTYREMKEFYSEQTAFERGKIEEVLAVLGIDVKIIPLGEPRAETPETVVI